MKFENVVQLMTDAVECFQCMVDNAKPALINGEAGYLVSKQDFERLQDLVFAKSELATLKCKICGLYYGTADENSKLCDRCWYGMRMAPKVWEKELAAEGVTIQKVDVNV